MNQKKPEILITVHVKPGAKKESIEWIDDDTIKVHVRAIAEKGKANEAVINLLSTHFGIKKSSIELIRGFTTQMKHFKILGPHPRHLSTKDCNE